MLDDTLTGALCCFVSPPISSWQSVAERNIDPHQSPALRRAGNRQKADERILGDNDFVSKVLQQANEQLERKHHLPAKGYNLEFIIERVAQLLELKPDQVLSNSKRRQAVMARSLVCFWSYKEMGMTQIELAPKFRITQPAVSAAVMKGEKLVKTNGYELLVV